MPRRLLGCLRLQVALIILNLESNDQFDSRLPFKVAVEPYLVSRDGHGPLWRRWAEQAMQRSDFKSHLNLFNFLYTSLQSMHLYMLNSSESHVGLIRFPELPVIDRCHAYAIRTKYSYKCVNCGYTIGKYYLILYDQAPCMGHVSTAKSANQLLMPESNDCFTGRHSKSLDTNRKVCGHCHGR